MPITGIVVTQVSDTTRPADSPWPDSRQWGLGERPAFSSGPATLYLSHAPPFCKTPAAPTQVSSSIGAIRAGQHDARTLLKSTPPCAHHEERATHAPLLVEGWGQLRRILPSRSTRWSA
ncbi:hypothetical protein GCM10022207_90800 [Streptomyces lannensis]|uniref:Uncharacterized protein n=1 Tax=Streptomyces lannensis TaxID=766498 RepID=A0ABP7LT76_9ACTN